jgi:peptidoglycan/xylan/chitin deacetylase (PgdA/CDA1 family)
MTIAQKIAAKATKRIKYLSRDLKHVFGLYSEFYKAAHGSRILVYHGICMNNHLKFNTLFSAKKTFEAHLQFYQQRFNVVSLDDYYQRKFSNDKFNVCLTFDDGFANNYKYVLPLLKKYQLPATFFITAIGAAGYNILWNDFLSIFSTYGPGKIVFDSEPYTKNRHKKYISDSNGIGLNDKLRNVGFAEKAQMMKELYPLVPFKTKKTDEDYWLQMTAGQIKELAVSPLVTIGAHGYYHNDLAKINIADAAEELISTKHYLENIIEKEISSVAFPYGSYSQEVVDTSIKAGYTQLLATEFISGKDHQNSVLLERLTINPFISVNNQMYATVKGSYEQ